jgi:hypothetical protein
MSLARNWLYLQHIKMCCPGQSNKLKGYVELWEKKFAETPARKRPFGVFHLNDNPHKRLCWNAHKGEL